MSKKVIIIISVILVLFLISLIGYYFILQNNQTDPSKNPIGFKSFYPFGGNDNNSGTQPPPDNGQSNPPPQQQTRPEDFTKKLRELSSEPVSGAGIVDVKAGSIVRYIEKATGHIYEVELFSPNKNRISNTTIPQVYNAVWGNENNSLIARYLKDDNQTVDVYSFAIKLSSSTENNLLGTLFPENITDISGFGTSVFYLEDLGDSSSGIISNFDGSKKKQIWNSSIKELLSQYVNAKTVALTTKPFENLPGYLYLVDTGTAGVRTYLNGTLGLSTLVSGDISKILYLAQDDNAKLFVYDTKTAVSTKVTPVTFPEKCAWGKKDKNFVYCAVPRGFIENTSLTSWYRGLLSTTDDIWKYDIKNNTSSVIENLSNDTGGIVDVIKPILSDGDQYLIFTNKIDNSLWSLDLTK